METNTDPFQKIKKFLVGWWNCLSWIFAEAFAQCVDLNLSNIPTHPSDFLWYAERVNGRLAMLSIIFILQLELITHESIFHLLRLW